MHFSMLVQFNYMNNVSLFHHKESNGIICWPIRNNNSVLKKGEGGNELKSIVT